MGLRQVRMGIPRRAGGHRLTLWGCNTFNFQAQLQAVLTGKDKHICLSRWEEKHHCPTSTTEPFRGLPTIQTQSQSFGTSRSPKSLGFRLCRKTEIMWTREEAYRNRRKHCWVDTAWERPPFKTKTTRWTLNMTANTRLLLQLVLFFKEMLDLDAGVYGHWQSWGPTPIAADESCHRSRV